MMTPAQIAERLEEWTGDDITPDQIKDMIWSFAVDHDLWEQFCRRVRVERTELAEQAKEVYGS